MKLRISSFKAALRKDITRFAPAWGLYLVGMVLMLLSYLGDTMFPHTMRNLEETLQIMGVVNALYAGLVAQLLFGDLFNSRLCNALHALPVRREDWFFSHVVAGLSFSLIPSTVCVLAMQPMLHNLGYVGLFWMSAMTMEYVFFFGLAVFSCLCSGSRFAAAAVYGILNILSMLAFWFVNTIYGPLMEGVLVSEEPFMFLCPLAYLTADLDLMRFTPSYMEFIGLGTGWQYLWVLTGAGVLLLVLALLLYRRRNLEAAGDFLAVRWLTPVFLVLYTLTVAVFFAFLGELFDLLAFFFIVGFFVGFFTGQMLLQRTVRIFSWKLFIKLAVFGAILTLSVVLTAIDPLGIVSYVPEQEDIQSVSLYDGRATYDNVRWIELTEDADIALVREVHQDRIGKKTGSEGRYAYLTIRYQLKDGRTVKRCYRGPVEGVRMVFSRPEHVLEADSMDAALKKWTTVRIEGKQLQPADREALLQAVYSDCVIGNMAQSWSFHNQYSSIKVWIELESGKNEHMELRVFEDAKNTMWWLKDHYEAWGPENVPMEDILGI